MQQQSQLQIQMVKSSDSEGDAPPKQVAQALERLGEAGRLIGDVRLGADRILESIFSVASPPSTPGHNSKYINAIAHQESLVHIHLQNLLILGKQLEESGVLNDSLRSRSNSWGLHMPLVCPDGAVVAYAWKRQLAGQAGASAVDRTRLALKGFTDQKRRFFLHLADDDSAAEPEPKKQCIPPALNYLKEVVDQNTVASILSHLKKQNPHLQTFTYERLDWLKRASDLASATNESSIKSSRDHSFPNTSKLRQGSISVDAAEKAAVIELFVPSVFRAVVSLHTAGSINPNSVAYFSPDEGGSYLHAGGFSSHHVFRHVSEHACMALQYFVCIDPETALFSFLCWVCSYQTLFIKSCSKCGKLLAMDKQSGLVLPPVKRPFRYLSSTKTWLNKSPAEKRGLPAFHIGCYSD